MSDESHLAPDGWQGPWPPPPSKEVPGYDDRLPEPFSRYPIRVPLPRPWNDREDGPVPLICLTCGEAMDGRCECAPLISALTDT